MISIKDFVKIIRNSKTVEYLNREAKEVYKNNETGVRLILEILDSNDEFLEKYIPITNIDTPDSYGRREILIEEDLRSEFVKWCLENKKFEEWDEKHQYYEFEFAFDYNDDYKNIYFEDELINNFYKEKKDDCLFFHPLLPIKNHQSFFSANQNEGWYYEKFLYTDLVLKIYNHLVENNL